MMDAEYRSYVEGLKVGDTFFTREGDNPSYPQERRVTEVLKTVLHSTGDGFYKRNGKWAGHQWAHHGRSILAPDEVAPMQENYDAVMRRRKLERELGRQLDEIGRLPKLSGNNMAEVSAAIAAIRAHLDKAEAFFAGLSDEDWDLLK